MSEKDKEYELDAGFLIEQAKGRNRKLTPYSPPPDTPTEDNADEFQAHAVEQKTEPPQETKRRKSKGIDYQTHFFRIAPIKSRSGKVAYIRKTYHDRIMKIIRVIGDEEMSLFSYLDNVLEHHFSMFEDEIKKHYNKSDADEYLNP